MSSYGERVRTLLEHGTVICECHTCMGSDGTAVLRILWDDGHISEMPYYKVVPSDKPGRPLFNGQPATDGRTPRVPQHPVQAPAREV
jgi:hypothetical protein